MELIDTTCKACVGPSLDPTPWSYFHLQMKHPLRDWRKLRKCQKVIKHSPEGGRYKALAVNSQGLLAVTDGMNNCVHLLTSNGKLMRSIGKGKLGNILPGVAFDLKGNVLVTDYSNNRVVKLSQDDQLLQTIRHAGSESDCFSRPMGVSVSTDGLIYICDSDNRRVTVHIDEGKFLYTFVSEGSGPQRFIKSFDVAFGSDGLVYVNGGDKGVCVYSKVASFERDLKPKYVPSYIATTSDNHLLITSYSRTAMVYTLEGELVHEFGLGHSHLVLTDFGICVDDNGVVYVADVYNKCIQVF